MKGETAVIDTQGTALSVRLQMEHAARHEAIASRMLRDCGWHIEQDMVFPPMCLAWPEAERVALRIAQRAFVEAKR